MTSTAPEDHAQIDRALDALAALDYPPTPLAERELLTCALRRLRLEHCLSYRLAGELLGMHGSNVCRAEHGQRKPPTVAELAAAFGITAAEVLTPCAQCAYRPPAGFQCLTCGAGA